MRIIHPASSTSSSGGSDAINGNNPPPLNSPPPPPPTLPPSIVSARLQQLRELRDQPPPPPRPLFDAPPPPLPPTVSPVVSGDKGINSVVLEWNAGLKKCLAARDFERFNRVKVLIDQLYKYRKIPAASLEQRREIAEIVEEGNRLLAMDFVSLSASSSLPSSTTCAVGSGDENIAEIADMLDASVLTQFARISSTAGAPWSSAYYEEINARKKAAVISSNHIFFDLKACIASICGPGEETELTFSIYNRSLGKFISENYVVKLTHNGMPTDEDRIGRLYTVFADLTRNDLTSDLFLVCKIIRCGRMVTIDKESNVASSSSESDSKIPVIFRRPFGYAVLDLTPIIMANDSEKEYLMKIYTCNDVNWASLYESIMSKSGGYETSSRAEMICVSLHVLRGDLPVLLKEQYPRFVVPVTSRLGFPDVILPGDSRNSIYLTLCSGEFAQGRKTTAKNVECAFEVRLADGQTLPSPIFMGCGVPLMDQFESAIFYHCNTPKWNETFRVDIPVSNFDRGSHLFCTFRHCSTSDRGDKNDKAFGFAVVPLMKEDETVIGDEYHNLTIYKYDKKLVKDSYLCLLDPAADQSKFMPLKDVVTVKTELCSTKLTQSVSLLKLLRWRKLESVEMTNVLKSFTFIGPVEIIKYLQDILDALFGILQSFGENPSDLSQLVFSALIFVLNIVISDRRFASFRPILDIYIDNHFVKNNVSSVWIQMLNCMLNLARNPKDPLLGKELRSSLKAWEYVFKFVVRSYLSSPTHEDHFCAQVSDIFTTTANLFSGVEASANDGTLIGAKILVLQNLAATIAELHTTQLFEPIALVDFISGYLESTAGEKKILMETRLSLCIDIISGPVFSDNQARQKISQLCSQLIIAYISPSLESSLVGLLNRLLFEFLTACIKTKSSLFDNHANVLSCVPLFIDMFVSRSDLELVRMTEIGILVVAIFQMLSEQESAEFIGRQPAFEEFLDVLFGVMRSFIGFSHENGTDGTLLFGIVPATWIPILNSIQHVVLKVSAVSAEMMQTRFLATAAPNANIRCELWINLINTIVWLLCETSNLIDLPQFNETDTVLLDIRAKGAQLISLIWYSLRAYHQSFIPPLIGPMLELTFCYTSKELQNVAIGLLVEMMEINRKQKKEDKAAESGVIVSRKHVRKSGGFMENASKLTTAEIECIERLDFLIMTRNKGDTRFQQWIVGTLKERLGTSREAAPFLQSLDRFLSLTMFVRAINESNANQSADSFDQFPSLQQGSAFDDDDLASLYSHLMQFTSLLDRTQIYVKYIHQLADLQLRCGNFAEAAWALNLHAQLYEWSFDIVPAIDTKVGVDVIATSLTGDHSAKKQATSEIGLLGGLLFPSALHSLHVEDQSFKRKELLTLTIIRLFTLAGHYENAIAFAETMAVEYAKTVFDFRKVSKIHSVVADLANLLAISERYYPEYYRVAFIGKGWNYESSGMLSVQGKQFIYRSNDWEKLGEFVERVQAKYPGAQLLKSNNWPPEESVMTSSEKWLQVCKVTPNPNLAKFPALGDPKSRSRIPENVAEWYRCNDTDSFTFVRPFKKNAKKKTDDEFVNLWTENYQLTTEYSFPHFLKRSEVIDCERTECSPIENAVKNVDAKNIELEALEKKYRPLTESMPNSDTIARAGPKRSHSSSGARNSTLPRSINCNPLTMSLNGAVDAPVNGGLPMYKSVFFAPAFLVENPEMSHFVHELRVKIDEQAIIINRCIELHEKIAPAEMRPLHETIVSFFKQNFASEISRLLVDLNTK